MIEVLLVAAASMHTDAEPIRLVHPRPAQTVTMHKTFTCGETVFEIAYTQTAEQLEGRITVRDGQTIRTVDTAQARLFDHLSYVDGASVTCDYGDLPAKILVSGTDRETGEVDQLYQLGYVESEGFGAIFGPRNDIAAN